ncbi:hypothetical protein L1987_86652 [Smallanthus sonchifolius]|uniref:Uncharacterized protein n=1 Tax=Smallanthus sonchifolius TaxID=185202 RepID=A0ACB8XZ77_9ASTR|nr:hypothetical protein L1987_86652 [Smallanthus sonchifolius]
MTTPTRRLEGKVALITGAASGIGECTAKLFAEHGAKVIIADIQDGLCKAVCDAIGSSNSTYVHCDVTNEEDVKNAIDTAITIYRKLDIMFNNAAIIDHMKPHIIDNEKIDFERVLNVNVTCVFLGMKHSARVMVPTQTGSIISTTSVASNVGGVATHAYCSAKHAVVGLTKNLAVELGQFGIRVNCLSPHGVATPLTKTYLGLEPESVEQCINSTGNLKGVTLKTDDIAMVALFLASDEAKYVSGQNLFIDGGFSITIPSLKMMDVIEDSTCSLWPVVFVRPKRSPLGPSSQIYKSQNLPSQTLTVLPRISSTASVHPSPPEKKWVEFKGPVRGISLKLQEEERERRMDFVPDEFSIKTDRIEVDKETIDLLASLGMSELPGIVLKEETPMVSTSIPGGFSGGRGGYGGGSGRRY